MHERLLSAAVMPMPCRVLGLDMMPYSLGCELQLFREDSPFLTLGFDEFNELSFEKQHYAVNRAVNICCRKAPRWFRLWAWMYLPRTTEALRLAVADFRNYLADGRLQFRSDLPKDNDLPVRYLGEPEILRLYRFVCSHVPRPEIAIWGKTAWDFPYSFAKMLSQGHAESAGNLDIYNAKDKYHEEYHAQCQSAREAWFAAGKDIAKRLAVIEQHPIVREVVGVQEEVAEFESQFNKGESCPA